MEPRPLFRTGETVRINPSKISDKAQPMIGKVIAKSFGWINRDDSVSPVWVYELDFLNASGSPMVRFPESCLLKVRKPVRRADGDPFIWELFHWFTMVVLSRRLVRAYDITGRLVGLYWDKASNWPVISVDGGTDYARKDVPYPAPIWWRN